MGIIAFFPVFAGFLFSVYHTSFPGNTNQVTKTISVDNYNEINISGSMDVELVPGKEGQITVTAPSNVLPYIKAESQNNALSIYSDQWKNFGFDVQFGANNRTLVTVPYEYLTRIKLSGSGKITSKSPIVTDNLTTNVYGSAEMDLNVITGNLEANTSGSGNITLTGKANNFVAQVFGSSTILASQLEAQNVKVSISGSGDIKLWATQSLKAETFGSGNIYYKGNPVTNDIKVSGSGQIQKVE